MVNFLKMVEACGYVYGFITNINILFFHRLIILITTKLVISIQDSLDVADLVKQLSTSN